MVLTQETNFKRKQPNLRRPGRTTTTLSPSEYEDAENAEDVVLSAECPEAYGYFPDDEQCDKYHYCE